MTLRPPVPDPTTPKAGGPSMPRSSPLNLSVVIITFNEERHLPRCLASLPPGAEVIVLDSGSSDRTEAVARDFGAYVSSRPFTDYSDQKNAAVALASRRWVLSVDADEELTAQLRQAVVNVCQAAEGSAGTPPKAYRLKRRLYFMGRLMRFGKSSDAPVRLFERGAARFSAPIHEKLQLMDNSPVGALRGELIHYSYDSLADYFERFNLYTSQIAANHRRQGRSMPPFVLHLLRPWGEFMMRYVLRLGFLDGYAGYCYALLSGLYTFVTYAKLGELEEPGTGGSAPPGGRPAQGGGDG